MKKFTINRKMWSRGDVYDNRLLRPEDNKMCCLGFFAKQILGLKNKDISDRIFLCKRKGKIKVSDKDEKGFEGIINMNDNELIEDIDREIQLKTKFKKLGYEMEFKG